LCFLEREVEFGALDGEPVKVLFTVISPTLRGHLHLMSRLAFALGDPEFKNALLREASREEVLREARRVEAAFPAPVPVPPAAEVN